MTIFVQNNVRVATLSITRDDIIKAALRKLLVIGEGETPSAEDYTNCTLGLNVMLKAWDTDGIYLWKVTEIQVPLVANINVYQIGPTATGTGAVVTDRPMRIMEGSFIRNSANNDTQLSIISRQEYDSLGYKSSLGTPNQIFYDPQLNNGILKVYGTPSDSTSTLYLVAQIPVYDFINGTDTLDVIQEGYQAVIYGLAEEMLEEYPVRDARQEQRIVAKAEKYRQMLANYSREEASVLLQPAPILRGYTK